MYERTAAPATTSLRSDALPSACSGCRNEIDVHLGRGTVEGPGGSHGAISYADTDIVVWDCPGCGATNADALNE